MILYNQDTKQEFLFPCTFQNKEKGRTFREHRHLHEFFSKDSQNKQIDIDLSIQKVNRQTVPARLPKYCFLFPKFNKASHKAETNDSKMIKFDANGSKMFKFGANPQF